MVSTRCWRISPRAFPSPISRKRTAKSRSFPMSQIERTVANIPPLHRSTAITQAVEERWDSLTKPRGSLGRLETEILRLAQIKGTCSPTLERTAIYVFCGDHGITNENV